MDRAFGIGGGHYRNELGSHDQATAWSFGQALDAKLDVAGHTGNERGVHSMMNALGGYGLGNAFAPTIHPGRGEHRFEDDNGWLGLDLMKAFHQTHNKADLKRAEGLFPFMKAGQVKAGGEHWEEHAKDPVRNMAASGSTAELALDLYHQTHNNKYLRFAENNEKFMDSAPMRGPDGLHIDTLADNGKKNTNQFTYNEGVDIGTDVGLYQATHDKKYLNLAEQTAHSSINAFGTNRLWSQAPAFNSIYFQNLDKLDHVAPDASYKQSLDQYLGRAWSQGRDQKTGVFDRGGIGKYDAKGNYGVIDQAAFAQMYALDADWSKKK